jgi:hypothetical protein
VSAWGLPAPKGVKTSWGARAIYSPPAGIDIVWDRQGINGAEEDCKGLLSWINKKGLKGLTKILGKKGNYLASDEDRVVEFREGGFVITANPRGSHGYLYIGAWPEVTDG